MEKTLSQLIDEAGFEIYSEFQGLKSDKHQMQHYKVTLTRGPSSFATVTLNFYMGLAHTREPLAHDVVSSLVMDAHTAESCEDACDVMIEFGYTDPKEARRVFKGCQESREKLKALLGPDYDTFMNAENDI